MAEPADGDLPSRTHSVLVHWTTECGRDKESSASSLVVEYTENFKSTLAHAHLIGATVTVTEEEACSHTVKMSGLPEKMAADVCTDLRKENTGAVLDHSYASESLFSTIAGCDDAFLYAHQVTVMSPAEEPSIELQRKSSYYTP